MKTTPFILSVLLLLGTFQTAHAKTDFKQMLMIKTFMRLLDTNQNTQIEIQEAQSRWTQAFIITDKNTDKVLSLSEFGTLFIAQSTQIKLIDPKSKLPSAEAVFKKLDSDKSRGITLKEFNQHALTRFRLVDTDENEAISEAELIAVKGQLSL
ncbi:MAG: hypothetical protein ACPG47_06650 [Leucothrix sp.]